MQPNYMQSENVVSWREDARDSTSDLCRAIRDADCLDAAVDLYMQRNNIEDGPHYGSTLNRTTGEWEDSPLTSEFLLGDARDIVKRWGECPWPPWEKPEGDDFSDATPGFDAKSELPRPSGDFVPGSYLWHRCESDQSTLNRFSNEVDR